MAYAQRRSDERAQVGRSLIAAMRALAAGSNACARRARDEAVDALASRLPLTASIECLADITEVVAEASALGQAPPLWALPGHGALTARELRLIGVIAALQRGDVCAALAGLALLIENRRVGRVLFPLKSLALRLERAGITVVAIGQRDFRVIAGTPQASLRRGSQRPHLRVAN